MPLAVSSTAAQGHKIQPQVLQRILKRGIELTDSGLTLRPLYTMPPVLRHVAGKRAIDAGVRARYERLVDDLLKLREPKETIPFVDMTTSDDFSPSSPEPVTDGNRKTIHLGTVPQRWATDLRDLVESLLQHQHHDQPIPAKVSERLCGLSAELQQRLAATGLITIADDHRITVGELLDTFAASREGIVKSQTIKNDSQAIRNLRDFCGERPLDEITIRDAEAFLRYLQTLPAKRRDGATLAPDTVHRRFKTARQVFETAVRDDLIGKNPFKHVKAHGGDLTERQEYIPTETVLRVIDAAPSLQWQLLIALSRFAGVRVPSEPRLLKWCDVDLTARTMRITSTKNERHAGRKYRTCPIVSDLVPYFEAAAKAPREPDGFVFSPAIRSTRTLRQCYASG